MSTNHYERNFKVNVYGKALDYRLFTLDQKDHFENKTKASVSSPIERHRSKWFIEVPPWRLQGLVEAILDSEGEALTPVSTKPDVGPVASLCQPLACPSVS